MAANSRMASAIQVLCFLARAGKDGTNSERIAESLRTNPVVVRRLLKHLEQNGIVEVRQGKDGGVRLQRSPKEITLDQVYDAVEGSAEIFALRSGGNPNCAVNRSMEGVLRPVFDAANSALRTTLSKTRLSSLMGRIQ